MNNRSDFVAGFILGGLLGTALALLFAPRPGDEMRDRLLDSADEVRERARERADEVLKKVRSAAEDLSVRGKSKVDESTAHIRESIDRGLETFEERVRGQNRSEERPEG